jgi:hypothetical protein
VVHLEGFSPINSWNIKEVMDFSIANYSLQTRKLIPCEIVDRIIKPYFNLDTLPSSLIDSKVNLK